MLFFEVCFEELFYLNEDMRLFRFLFVRKKLFKVVDRDHHNGRTEVVHLGLQIDKVADVLKVEERERGDELRLDIRLFGRYRRDAEVRSLKIDRSFLVRHDLVEVNIDDRTNVNAESVGTVDILAERDVVPDDYAVTVDYHRRRREFVKRVTLGNVEL